jgi:hypothetical protein
VNEGEEFSSEGNRRNQIIDGTEAVPPEKTILA